jgi:glutamate dehydrogenase
VQDLLVGRIVWFLRNLDLSGGVAPIVARYREGISALQAALPEVMGEAVNGQLAAREAELVGLGMAAAPARRLAALTALTSAPDIVRIAETGGGAMPDIAATHFALDRALRLSELAAAARAVATGDTYDRIALERAVSTIATAHRRLTAEVVGTVGAGPEAVTAWSRSRGAALDHARATLEAVTASGLTVSKATVAASLLADLARPKGAPAQG